ncbi:hypothetical protein D6853_09480 [Butyrivibrio sp. X503]|uniref:hypothetical protein n=1 Tax=Butyrivibrio sp. X503 TaxID=2364878 RepID=UPI000EAA85B3|nr:hypothetical protein [Butyrivibrio sp. X503]RKM55766.1 hypothetical protein D6853_09480 [Butyrivibrio sp. X503]
MSKLNNVNYVIDNYDANLILADSLWMMPGDEVNVEGKKAFIIKRGLLGKILIVPDLSFDEYSVLYKSVLSHCEDLKKNYKAGRVLFVVKVNSVDDKILEHLKGVLALDKVFTSGGSFQVTFIDCNDKKGYFGGTKEPGKTLLYRDTWKYLLEKT